MEGQAASAPAEGSALFYRVTPGYFNAMGIPVLAGRDIQPGDRGDSPPVAVVSSSFVECHLAGQDPPGHRFRFGRDESDPTATPRSVLEGDHGGPG